MEAGNYGRPREANLRRAVSTAYYAMFHCLAASCADALIGGQGANRRYAAWRQTYRALQHGTAKARCQRQRELQQYPSEIQVFAALFVSMQQERHWADYDPAASFSKNPVIQRIAQAEAIIADFLQAPLPDRRAFAAYVLLDFRADEPQTRAR